jgi:DNA-binding IclR family transcriptional regulator
VLTRVGGRFALHATGVGLVLLAHAPGEVQDEVLRGRLQAWTPRTITDPVELRATLAQVRREGYAISRGQVTLDALSLACPVRGADGEVVAAVSLVVHGDTAEPLRLLPALRAAALGISRRLGG